ncbi:MAG: DUF4132 domain-containing protein [Oscillospiraceae bacterium]|nr:DUF4132 domain-containing protein [Oscillospiraceae bacterium]
MGYPVENYEIVAEYGQRFDKMKKGDEKNFIGALFYRHKAQIPEEYTYNDAFRKLCGHGAEACETLDDFFCKKLLKALTAFFGKEETMRIRAECELLMEFPYSASLYRPSYRSCRARDYADIFFETIHNALQFISYGLTAEQAFLEFKHYYRALDNRAAILLRQGDKKIYEIVEEAIFGENSNVQLSHWLISAVVKSGESRALEMLGKLLLAAKGQEGVRQAIAEKCDQGTLSSHIYFIKLILENDLCRFSSVMRAFATWSGLAFDDVKQKVVEKCMSLALKYLSDDALVEEGVKSEDVTEIYLALWARSCRDIYRATDAACEILGKKEKYRRLAGWYFITHANGDIFRHKLAAQNLHVQDPEELAWICRNIYVNSDIPQYYYYRYDKEREEEARGKLYPSSVYPEKFNERAALFEKIAEKVTFIGNKSTKFKESVFPWYSIELSSKNLCGCLLGLAAYDRSEVLTERLYELVSYMDSDMRQSLYLFVNPEIPKQRAMLLKALSDKSLTVKNMVTARLGFYSLTKRDVAELTSAMTTTSANFRKNIMSLLQKQELSVIRPALDTLLSSKNKNQLIAGAELLDIFTPEAPALREEYNSLINAALENEATGQDVKILLEKIISADSQKDEYTEENGYGLFEPKSDTFNVEVWKNKRPAVKILSDKELRAAIVPNEKELFALFGRVADVFIKNADYEYEVENWDGSRQTVLLNSGGTSWGGGIRPVATSKRKQGWQITDYPLSAQFTEAVGEYFHNQAKLAAVLSVYNYNHGYVYRQPTFKKWFEDIFKGYPYDNSLNDKLLKFLEHKAVNLRDIITILNAVMNTGEADLDFNFAAYVNLVNKIPPEKLGEQYIEVPKTPYIYRHLNNTSLVLSSTYLCYWRNISSYSDNDEYFEKYFSEMWYQHLASGGHFYGIGTDTIFRAHHLKLIPDEAVYEYLSVSREAERAMHSMTGSFDESKKIYESYLGARGLVDTVIDRMVEVESNRGELPTALTKVALSIKSFNGGIKHFVKLLTALGDAGFKRGGYYYGDSGEAKATTLSLLLRRCRPAPSDTSEELRAALKSAKITESRAIQAALYAPMWAGLIEKAAGIVGLKCGVWFFHAHINERFSVEKETEAAIFSAITPQQFADGTFDKAWFFEAFNTLGEKRFNELYKNAKYITESGISHRRSQLYADAVLERINKDEVKDEIEQKRNQEKLRAYALIPLAKNNKCDALERYEFICKFKKESRQFGSQRQASEGKAARIALENLAVTTGYHDVERMVWALEGEKIEQLKPLMSPHDINGVEVWLNISEDGSPEAVVRKNGKLLKAIPKDLAKNSYVLDIKEAVKELKEQKRRARYSFEAAMISRAAFTVSETAGLLCHPVLKGTVSALVLTSENATGFPMLQEGKLYLHDYNGEVCPAAQSGKLFIAHPHDLISSGEWSHYQRYLYQNKITQPFKQVFREYYPLTQDELDSVNISNRYAGHQVQPKKTVALLKSRGWSADYEEGLQRVWHKENLIVRMYALADWFSPAEIEAPTLESIRFYSRDKHEPIAFSEIPPIIFSETMRDIDLVVSVAHAGGVDPEASHSTVEMRVAIARELLAMLSVKNVEFKTAHALIKGSLGDFSVHMGSGVVHKSGTGMIAVLPVHSQARGRIFLPFADDDPKTAEVLSKILLFADDKKIKDPSILGQICGKR